MKSLEAVETKLPKLSHRCSFTKVDTDTWYGLAKRLDLASFQKVTIICKHATLNCRHVGPAHISHACLVSKWCQKAPVLASLDAQTLEKVRRRLCHTLSSGATTNTGGNIHAYIGIQVMPFILSPSKTSHAIAVSPEINDHSYTWITLLYYVQKQEQTISRVVEFSFSIITWCYVVCLSCKPAPHIHACVV